MTRTPEVILVLILRNLTVSTPVTDVFACISIKNDNPSITITIRDEDLVSARIYPDTCRAPKQLRIGVATCHVILTDLHLQLTRTSELHDSVMAISANPYVVVVIYEQSVGITRKLRHILCLWITPTLNYIPFGIKLDHNRSRAAT